MSDSEFDQPIDDAPEDLPDWSQFCGSNGGIPGFEAPLVVPKRGEKGFEPTANNYDALLLQHKRSAMYSAMTSQERGHHHKNRIEAFWDISQDPATGVAVVPRPKGSVLTNVGYRSSENKLLLNFEEILYLLERGSVECWMVGDNGISPMSLQTAYSLFLGSRTDYDMFFVYSHLKRHGYVLRRLRYNVADISSKKPAEPKVTSLMSYLYPYFSWKSLYASLDVVQPSVCEESSFQVIFNVWKPGQSPKREPDFYLSILNADHDVLPDFKQLGHAPESLILALVDNGIVNFVRMGKGVGQQNVFLTGLTKPKKSRRVRR